MVVGGGVPVAASCTEGVNDSAIIDRLGFAGTQYGAGIILASGYKVYQMVNLGASTYTITKYVIQLRDSSQAGNVSASLYTSQGAAGSETINTIIADTTVAVAHDSIPDHPTWGNISFVLATPKTGQTGKVWVVAEGTGTGAYFGTEWNDGDTGYRAYSNDNSYSDNTSITMAVYGCVQ
jgi:hypothetical protein